jgi:alpha-beta hydrolase superfamily lysophospholipase
MQYTFERFYAADGVELCGMLSVEPANTEWAVIHVHGLAGNFYEQLFVDHLARAAVAAGLRFLSFNNRGHDYFSDAYRQELGTRKSSPMGGAHERLTEASLDLAAALLLVAEKGIENVVLSCHSTGAVKVVRFLFDRPPAVQGLVLLSPSDDVAIQASNAGERYTSTIELAQRMVDAGQSDRLLPEGTFFYPIDARAYLDLFSPTGIGNIFDLTNRGKGLQALNHVTVPTLVVFGSSDIAVVGSPHDAAEQIAASLGEGVSSERVVIDGADHSYIGHEARLGLVVGRWLKELSSRTS